MRTSGSVAVLVIVLHVEAIAANLITNPGLEEGISVPSYWGTIGGGTLTYLQGQTPGNNCHAGSRAVSIQSPSPYIGGWFNTNYVAACAGQTLRVRAWVRSINFDADDFVTVYFEQYDAANNSLGVSCGTALLGSSAWRESTNVFVITNAAVASVRAFFLFGCSATPTTGQAIYDDVALELLSSTLQTSRLANVSFDGGVMTLSIANLTIGSTNYVDRTLSLSTSWTNVSTFIATGVATNWSETVSNQWLKVFYRVTSKN